MGLNRPSLKHAVNEVFRLFVFSAVVSGTWHSLLLS